MSYSSNKRKKNRKQFMSKICKTFDEFCVARVKKAPIIMSKDEYDLNMRYWLSYKNLYELELTDEEKSWAKNHVGEEKDGKVE